MKDEYVSIKIKDIKSYYSFLNWVSNNFSEKIKERSDVGTLLLIILRHITDEASKTLTFLEKKEFKKYSERLDKRIRSKYENQKAP